MRSFIVPLFVVGFAACGVGTGLRENPPPDASDTPDATQDTPPADVVMDVPVPVDTAVFDTGSTVDVCADCLHGRWRVVSTDPSMRAWTLEVDACGGMLRCRLDGRARNCFRTPEPAFRVDIDNVGYDELIFTNVRCDRLSGVHASEGGGPATSIVATHTD